MTMKTNNWQLRNPALICAYITFFMDWVIHLKVVRIGSRAIFAGLVVAGGIDYVPTILAISRIILVYINVLLNIVQYLFTTNDAVLAEICTLISNASNQSTVAVEYYEQIVSRD